MPKFKNIRIKKPGGGFRMQRAQVLKSGKLKFVKNTPRGGGRKTAAKKPARKRSKSVAKKGNPGHRSQKMGAVLKGARAVDTVSGPAQGVITTGGDVQALVSRYDNQAAITTSASAGGVGLVRNVITSKSGAYRGVSQNKILSYVQVLAPELVAASEHLPWVNPRSFNDARHLAHEGYNPAAHTFSLSEFRLRRSSILQALAWGGQKLAQKLGINRMLPKGWNL